MSDTDKDQEQEQEQEQEQALPGEEGAVDSDDAAADAVAAEEPEDKEDTAVDAPDDEESAAVEEPDDEESAAVEEPVSPAVPVRKGGKGIAWLALLVAAIALAAVGYTVSRDFLEPVDTSAADAVQDLERQLAAAEDSRKQLAARVEELGATNQAGNAEVDALRQEFDERVRLLSSLPARMSTLESSVSSLAGVSAGARDTWLLAEAEYYMQIANAQLQLANNPHLANLALRMADERIVQLANPALTDVRRAISDELAALEVMEKPDIEGATLTLASLARVVESLPLNVAEDAEDAPAAADQEQSGFKRAWSSIKGAMSGLVKVTPPDQAKLTLLTPDAEYFLRNNIALQLQSARLALLRGEQAVFEQTIDDTSALLKDYFDSDSAQVISAQETLAEIRGNVFTTSVPDISESLRLLRQYRTLSENPQ